MKFEEIEKQLRDKYFLLSQKKWLFWAGGIVATFLVINWASVRQYMSTQQYALAEKQIMAALDRINGMEAELRYSPAIRYGGYSAPFEPNGGNKVWQHFEPPFPDGWNVTVQLLYDVNQRKLPTGTWSTSDESTEGFHLSYSIGWAWDTENERSPNWIAFASPPPDPVEDKTSDATAD